MYTQCPHCQQVHALDAMKLRAGRGQMRCEHCGNAFDALARIVEDARELTMPMDADLDLFAPAVKVGATSGDDSIDPVADTSAAESAAADDEPPAFLLDHASAPLPHGGRWWMAVMAAALLLCSQLVLSQRAQLAEDPGLRPWLQRVCDWMRCDLPAFRAPKQIHVLTRDVQPHPSVPDALLISASFRNDAHWAQAWPVLELSLSDLDGRLVALRRFRPEEYLGQPPSADLLDAGQPVAIELELVDPGKQAIAYEFNFL